MTPDCDQIEASARKLPEWDDLPPEQFNPGNTSSIENSFAKLPARADAVGEDVMKPDRDQIEKFVRALFKYATSGNWVALRAFRDGGGGPPLHIPAVKLNGKFEQLIDAAYRGAKQAASNREKIVFCPPIAAFTNDKHAREQDLAEGLALSVECDKRAEAARARLEELLGPATIVVASGGESTNPETGEVEPKLHLHWRLKTPARSNDEQRNLKEARRLAAVIVGGDKSNVPLVHPIRWPGSVHRKSKPRLCRIVASSENEIDLNEALAWLREAVGATASPGATGSTGNPRAPHPEAAAAALAVIPNNDEHWSDWNRIGMATWGATGGEEIGREAFHGWSAKSEKNDLAETEARWQHYKTSPPTKIGFGTLVYLARQHAPGWSYHADSQAEFAKHTTEGHATNDDAEITRLATLPLFEYDRERKAAAKALGIRTSLLDPLVKAERVNLGLVDPNDNKQGRAISFPEIEPWPEAVDGAELLDGLANAIRRHVVFGEAARDTTALWVAHTYLVDVFLISPRLGVTSPAKQCGKTTLFDVLAALVLRGLSTANISPAVVFRVVEMYRPCLLIDEADTFLGVSDELRGVLNSGHRKGGQVLRAVGDDHEPRAFSTYGPCAIALIGALPDTLHDRSVRIDLKRRLKTEHIEPFSLNRTDHFVVLARKAARWAADNAERVGEIEPVMPDGIVNREADNWRPLLAIAEAAGGDWPERAQKAAKSAADSGEAVGRTEVLLADIKAIFKRSTMPPADKNDPARIFQKVPDGFRKGEPDRIASSDLVEALVELEGHPWAEMGKLRKPLNQNRLARMLKPLGIAPETIRIGEETLKGYFVHVFDDAFERFCS